METKKKRSGYLSSDWNTLRPNTIWISKRYTNSGNCIIAVRIWNGKIMIPFRAGHPLDRVHQLTVIQYEDSDVALKLNTKRMYKYLKENSWNCNIFTQNFNFGKTLPTDGYRVVIADLLDYASVEKYPLTNDLVGQVS